MFLKEMKWAFDVVLDPSKNTKKTFGYWDFSKNLMKISVIPAFILGIAVSIIISFAGPLLGLPPESSFAGPLMFFLIVPLYIILVPVCVFIWTSIVHFLGKFVFKFFKGSFYKTFNAASYSIIPALLMWWIPFVGEITLGWSILTLMKSLTNHQKTSNKEGFIIGISPIVIIGIVYGMLILSSILSVL